MGKTQTEQRSVRNMTVPGYTKKVQVQYVDMPDSVRAKTLGVTETLANRVEYDGTLIGYWVEAARPNTKFTRSRYRNGGILTVVQEAHTLSGYKVEEKSQRAAIAFLLSSAGFPVEVIV